MFSKQNNFSNYCPEQVQPDNGLNEFLWNWCSWDSEVCLWPNELVPCITSFGNWTESLLNNQIYWNWDFKQLTNHNEETQNSHQLITSQTNYSKLRFESDFNLVPVKTRRRNTSPLRIESNLKKILELHANKNKLRNKNNLIYNLYFTLNLKWRKKYTFKTRLMRKLEKIVCLSSFLIKIMTFLWEFEYSVLIFSICYIINLIQVFVASNIDLYLSWTKPNFLFLFRASYILSAWSISDFKLKLHLYDF